MVPESIVDPNNWQSTEVAFYFEQAIEISRKQRAMSFELHATISLARFLKKENKPKEAFRRLKRIYEWFTEGFDTANLREARELLQSLK
jgi:hypothetical protein